MTKKDIYHFNHIDSNIHEEKGKSKISTRITIKQLGFIDPQNKLCCKYTKRFTC